MAAYFLDTSAVAKRYLAEIGSTWITALTEPAAGNDCRLAAVTRVEALAAFYLRVRTGTLSLSQAQVAELAFRHELNTHYQLLPLTPVMLDQALQLVASYPLRGFDAVQLASALAWDAERLALGEPPQIFLSADQNLLRAAAAVGLTIDDPNLHP